MSRAAAARCCDNLTLKSSSPVLSVCPSISTLRFGYALRKSASLSMPRSAPGPTSALPAAKSTSPTVSTRPRSVCCALRLASSLARVALASSAARACVSARAARPRRLSPLAGWRLGQTRLPARLLRLAGLCFGLAELHLGVAGARLGRTACLLTVAVPRLRSRACRLELTVAHLEQHVRHLPAELLDVLLRPAGGAGHRCELSLPLGQVAEVQLLVEVLRPFGGQKRLLRVREPPLRVGLHARIGAGLL